MLRDEPVSEPKPDGKPFAISKRLVWEAWRRVKTNDGAEGVDEESIEEFERDLKDVMSSPSDRERAALPSSSADYGRAGRVTVEPEEASSEHRNGT